MTKDIPFSNATEFEMWQDCNCVQCDQYENESTIRSDAKCKYAFDLEIAQVSGEIPIKTINYFGYKKNFMLANCPRLYCGRIKKYEDFQKAKRKAEKNKKNELPLKF